MASYYYNVTLTAPVPHGSDFLNRPCSVVFTYPNGSQSQPYSATAFAWPNANIVRIVSPYMNIEAAAQGMNGGTLTLTTPTGQLQFNIQAFAPTLSTELASDPAAPTANGPSPIFGVVLNLNGQNVPIVANSLADIKNNGFNFTLPQSVSLGTPDDFIAWIDTTFSVDLKSILDPSNLPAPIKNVVDKLLNVEIFIDQAIVDVPGAAQTTATTTYKLVISAVFPGDGVPLIPGVLSLQGGTAGVISNPAPPGA